MRSTIIMFGLLGFVAHATCARAEDKWMYQISITKDAEVGGKCIGWDGKHNFYASREECGKALAQAIPEVTGMMFLKAAKDGELEKVRAFVAKGVDVNLIGTTGDTNGMTALMAAESTGHLDVVKFLRSKGANGANADKLLDTQKKYHQQADEFESKHKPVAELTKDCKKNSPAPHSALLGHDLERIVYVGG